MEISALQIARAAYQPKLPKALQGPVKAVEGEATQSVGNQDDIKALFPNTYGMPVITFEAGEKKELPAFNVSYDLSSPACAGYAFGANLPLVYDFKRRKIPQIAFFRSKTVKNISQFCALFACVYYNFVQFTKTLKN